MFITKESRDRQSGAPKTDSIRTLGPVFLEGRFVVLEPMLQKHAPDILDAGKELDWAWMSVNLDRLESVENWISDAIEAERRGEEFAFVVKEKSTGDVIGSTRYMDTHSRQRGTEIGWTWYTPTVWGTVVNPECKLLLLTHAFEDWGAIRVQLKTDYNNVRSQRAIEKLGAKYEGRLRNHRFRADGTIRDSVMYSIIPDEWPTVKASLIERVKKIGNAKSH
jgi:N-acetyltransferase